MLQIALRNSERDSQVTLLSSLTQTRRWFAVQTFVTQLERNRSAGIGLRQLNDVNAVEIFVLPIWHAGGIASVSGNELAGQLFNFMVFPRHNDNCVPVVRSFEFMPERFDIREPDAGIDRKTKKDGRGLDRRERPDIIIQAAVVFLRLGGIGREHSVWFAE